MLNVQIITPESTLFSGEADMVVAPGTEGEFGVLPGHAPFVSTLRPGIVTIDRNGAQQKVALIDGVAEVTPEHCTILSESARALDGISAADAQTMLRDAEAQVTSATGEEQTHAAEKRVQLARVIAENVA